MNVQVAKLDADSVYWGLDEKALEEVKAGDVVFNAETFEHEDVDGVVFLVGGCDLKPGQYRWDGAQFVPLKLKTPQPQPATPLVERALHELVSEMIAAGASVPEYTRKWHAWYAQSLDNK